MNVIFSISNTLCYYSYYFITIIIDVNFIKSASFSILEANML
jgi:hypothetical protein